MIEQKWYKSSEKRPEKFQHVWGLFKGRDVEVCMLALTDDEYDRYFEGFYDSSWYSFESEKTGRIEYWHPINRPNKPSLE